MICDSINIVVLHEQKEVHDEISGTMTTMTQESGALTLDTDTRAGCKREVTKVK